MNAIKYTLVLFISLLSFTTTFAQTATSDDDKDKLSLNSGTIDSQFEFVFRRSNSWQDFKVIKKNWFYTLKSHTVDTLKLLKKQLKDTKTTIDSQAEEISGLKNNLGNTQNTLAQTNVEKDSMSLFGLQMSKGGYNTLMWSIIGGLLGFLLFFIYKFKSSNTITKQAKHNLTEIENEFEDHRRNALEREQKVRRQLQDEINKQKNS